MKRRTGKKAIYLCSLWNWTCNRIFPGFRECHAPEGCGKYATPLPTSPAREKIIVPMSRPRTKLPPENGHALRPPPTKRAPVLTKESQAIFSRFEKEMGLPLLAYWTSSGGSICQNDVMAMAQLLDTRKHGNAVGLFLKSEVAIPRPPCASSTFCAANTSG